MKRKTVSIIVTAAILFCNVFYGARIEREMVMAAGQTEEVQCGAGAYWTLDEATNQLIINGTGSITYHTFPKDVDSVVIGRGITEIGSEAFRESTLGSVSLPDTLTSIGDSAFWGCDNLEQVMIPDAVRKIGNAAFEHCTSMKKFEVGDRNEFFADSQGVLYTKNFSELLAYPAAGDGDSFSIPETVTKIGMCAFDYNKSLKKLEISKNVSSLGEGVPFLAMTAIEEFAVSKENLHFQSVDGDLYDKEKTTLIKYAVGKDVSYYETDSDVKIIGDNAFQGAGFSEVRLTGNVSEINYGAFRDCNKLSKITVENPNCMIAASIAGGIPQENNLNICGYDNSTAQAYAYNNGFEFEMLKEDEIVKIEILNLPKKTVYKQGEPFSTVGLVLKIYHSDGSCSERSMGYETGDVDTDSVGIKEVLVSYAGCDAVFTIEVVETLPERMILEGETLTVDIVYAGQTESVYFVPTQSGTYNFYSVGGNDTAVILYDSNDVLLAENDDADGNRSDFLMTYYFSRGEKYRFECRLANESEIKSFDVTLECVEKETETSVQESPTPEVTEQAVTTSDRVTTTPYVTDKAQDKTVPVVTTKKKGDPKKNQTTTKVKKPARVTVKRVTRLKGNKKAKVIFRKVKNATKYKIAYSTSKKFTKKTTRYIIVRKTTVTLKKLKQNKKYYVKVRAIRVVRKKTYLGKWSKVKNLKVLKNKKKKK